MRKMRWLLLGLLFLPHPAPAELVAERIRPASAPALLFGGSDADGGVDDWYLSNGVIEAIVDDVGPQSDLPPGVVAPPRQSEAGATGGGLIDLGLVGADNDQLGQMFTVGGLSADNFVLYDTIEADVTDSAARVTVSGRLPGFPPLEPEELAVATEYIAAGSDPFLTIRTTVSNQGGSAVSLGGFLDVFPWTTRAIVPFSPLPRRGFRHAELDLANPAFALETPIYSVGPGNVSPADGIMDPQTGTRAGEVAYGLLGVETRRDPDGPGGAPPVRAPVDLLFGVSSVQATAFGNLPLAGGLPPGGALVYERRIYVGARNDVASAANAILRELGPRLGFANGTLSGDVDAIDGRDVAVSAVVTRVAGPAIAGLPAGAPVTHFRSDASGRFEGVVVPQGVYEIEFRAVERDPVVVAGVEVQAGGDTRVSVPLLAGLATLALRVDVGGDRGRAPVKVTIRGRDGTPDPQLGRDFDALSLSSDGSEQDLAPESFGGSLAQGAWLYLPHGEGEIGLRPGAYEVFASRGPEYGIDRARVSLAAGERTPLRLRLRRLLRTRDALSADFHVHSARSFDASAGPESRVVSFAAEGVEVMLSSDHDFVLDYAPVIRTLGLGRFLSSRVGNEVTTVVPNPPLFPNAVGHMNAWPLEVDATARKDGAIEDEFVAPNFLFSRLRRSGAEVIQYNHPRAGVRGLTTIGLFNNIGCNRCENDVERTCSVDSDCPLAPAPRLCTCVGYRPERPLSAPPNDVLLDDDVTGSSGVANPDGIRNIDFDVIEVGNGLNVRGYLEVRRDWFSLLNQAHALTPRGPVPFIAGTGVSDSHRNTLESAGYFRTYVLGVGDDPARVDAVRFDANVRSGRMLATTGPWIALSARDRRGRRAGIGDMLAPEGGTLWLSVRVAASNWVPVDEVRIIVNGQLAHTFDATSAPAVGPAPQQPWSRSARHVQRFWHTLPLTLERDSWILVEAGARLDPPPAPDAFASQLVPDFVSLAFTNPIFVDLEGDGFDPPGIEAGAAPRAVETRRRAAPAGADPHSRSATAAPHGVHDHLPLHRLRIPEHAVQQVREQLAR